MLFDVKGKSVTFKKAVEMKNEPLNACFDSKGNLWCTTDSQEEPLDVVLAGKGYSLATKESKELLGLVIDRSLITNGNVLI